MSKETIKIINQLLKSFNNTFEIEANLSQENNEMVADKLIIKSVKNDGSNFISLFHNTFNTIVQSMSDEYEVIYHEEKGLVVAKKIVKTEYIVDDLD